MHAVSGFVLSNWWRQSAELMLVRIGDVDGRWTLASQGMVSGVEVLIG